MDKTGRKNKIYSPKFKISVIMDMREHHLVYCETIRKYWNDGQEVNHLSQISCGNAYFYKNAAKVL